MPEHRHPSGLVLASGSPRRRELLTRLEVPFQVDPGGATERAPYAGEDPTAYALALARHKALVGAERHPDAIVLGADTVVTIDGLILGKPRDEDQALHMLRCLRGRVHSVVTGVAIRGHGTAGSDAASSRVLVHDVNDEVLRAYIATGEPMDKAGAYAVQGMGGRLIAALEGCYNNVVGLPLCLTARFLTDCGIEVDVPPEIDPHMSFAAQ